MCAQYLIKGKIRDFNIRIKILVDEEGLEFDQRITPFSQAPVFTNKGFKMMNYSLTPSWSKEPRMKFATYNARVETIDQKPTWKRPFLTNHCLVPLTSFIEPIYDGELAGNMVRFSGKSHLVATGIFDQWVNKATGEVIDSFAIVTTEPCDFVRSVGHDRQPIFLSEEGQRLWLESDGLNASELKALLSEHAVDPELTTSIDRKLKAGWEKRR